MNYKEQHTTAHSATEWTYYLIYIATIVHVFIASYSW